MKMRNYCCHVAMTPGVADPTHTPSNTCNQQKNISNHKQMSIVCAFFLIHIIIPIVGGDIIVNQYFPLLNETVNIKQYRDLAALGNWAAPIPENGIEGWLVHAEPKNACLPLRRATTPPGWISRPWIVLARRHNCSFDEKARHAQNAGYSAIIIHNVGSNEAIAMSGSEDVFIPVVSMGEFDAADLDQYNINVSPYFQIMITDFIDFRWLEKYLWPFFGLVTGCFFCMGLYLLIKWLIERRRVRRIVSRRRLSEKQLKKIPTKKFKKGDAYEICAICLEDYEENEKLRILPCNHAYHTKCVDPWLTKSRKSCPVCKRKILTKKEKKREEQREAREERERQEGGEEREEEESERESSAEDSEEHEAEAETQPLLQEPVASLSLVARVRRFFRRGNTIEVEVDDGQGEADARERSGGQRSSYGSLATNNPRLDPVNSQIEAAEQHLQQHLSSHLQHLPQDEDLQHHAQQHAQQLGTTVQATVHVEVHDDEEDGASSSSGSSHDVIGPYTVNTDSTQEIV